MNIKLNPRKYYKSIDDFHVTGDIWKGLPTMGLLKQLKSSGLIVTPACDLANAKVETIIYLPIIPIKNFFTSRAFYYEVRSQFLNLTKERIPNINDYLLKNTLPKLDDCEVLEEMVNFSFKNEKKPLVDRVNRGLEILKIICANIDSTPKLEIYRDFFGEKTFKNFCIGIIRNSYSNDLHFLPKDQEDVEWSSIFEHSVVLFRYPITIPIEILDLAGNFALEDWKGAMANMQLMYPVATAFIELKPVKTTSLNIEFLSDLLTRFCGLYMRIGSPDFTNDTIHDIVNEIK